MTWYEVKLAALQKMMSANGTNIPTDEATAEYVAGMPQAANEALQLLFSANRFLRKSVEVVAEADADGYQSFYDMSQAEDFHMMGDIEAYELKDGKIRSCNTMTVRAGKYVSFDAPGVYQVYYNAWPKLFALNTDDDYNIPLEDDVVVLLPLYMASQLYKDDDIAMATVYRNEFEAARAELRNRTGGTHRSTFVNKSGW
jgi:hypothetical protein